MRFIQKKKSPSFFEEWKENFKSTEGKEPAYQDLRGDNYHKLKTHIIDEQYGLCCYCCKVIEDYNSHIEHFKPQHSHRDDDLNYSNLIVSCNGYKSRNENCGHKKDDWYSEYYTISPLDENCETFFEYTIDGHIKAKHNDTRPNETINHLELNLDLLQRARKSALFISGFFDDDFEDKKSQFIDFYNTPHDGRLQGFCQSIVYCMSYL